MRKRCKLCGCYLDPGEWCKCEDDAPEVDQPHGVMSKRTAPPPREWNSEAYIRQKCLEFDMR